MDAGGLVPDSVVIGLVKERIQKPDARAATCWTDFTHGRTGTGIGQNPGRYEPENRSRCQRRSSQLRTAWPPYGRRTCRACGAGFHVMFDPPKKKRLRQMRRRTYQRSDDNEATVKSRLETYEAQTKPLIDYYEKQGKLRRIDGVGKMDDILQRIQKVLG